MRERLHRRRSERLVCCPPARSWLELQHATATDARDLALGRRRGNDVVEAHRSCGPADFDEAEVPYRLRHRAPLFALGADVERAASSTHKRRVVAARPARHPGTGETWDTRVHECAHTVGDREAIDEDHAVALAQR